MKAAMTEGDAVITAYRCHGWTYLLGSTATQVLAELTGEILSVSAENGGAKAKHYF